METQNQYIPGVCNIGPQEIRRRKQAGWMGLLTTVTLWAVFIWFDVSPLWRLTLFIPAMMAAIGFQQAYMRFCVYYGFARVFNFEEIGKTSSTQQAGFQDKDGRKAWQIIIVSILVGLVISFSAYVF